MYIKNETVEDIENTENTEAKNFPFLVIAVNEKTKEKIWLSFLGTDQNDVFSQIEILLNRKASDDSHLICLSRAELAELLRQMAVTDIKNKDFGQTFLSLTLTKDGQLMPWILESETKDDALERTSYALEALSLNLNEVFTLAVWTMEDVLTTIKELNKTI